MQKIVKTEVPKKKVVRIPILRVTNPAVTDRRERQIQQRRITILKAALKLFSRSGFHGVSIDQIASLANVSKTNLLYYFESKEGLYLAVLRNILAVWLEPLRTFSADQDPHEVIGDYIKRKLIASRDNPEASRLFCMEVVQGAPLFGKEISHGLLDLVNSKVAVIEQWIADGRLSAVDPKHFLFSLWSTTQHYADFSFQVHALTGHTLKDTKFFDSVVKNVQQIFLEGVIPRTVSED